MPRYAILAHPGHNRVYFEQSQSFWLAELALLGQALSSPPEETEIRSFGGIPYIAFSSAPLTGKDLSLLSRLSFCYALFSLGETSRGEACLLPLSKSPPFLEDSLSAMLKYTGKTNELFTRMLVGVAAATSAFDPLEKLSLLDPVAGKGTTLFEALQAGYDAAGIEIGDKVVAETYHFFKRYLETARYKHAASSQRVSGPARSFTALKYDLSFAKTKEEYAAKGSLHTLELVAGDSRHAPQFFSKNRFHLIVGDLPYGVQHGNVTAEKQSSLTRSPAALLESCLPGWVRVLRPGGTLALSWNVFVLPKEQMRQLLSSAGLTVQTGGPYDRFEHRVDQAIKRDIVVAVK